MTEAAWSMKEALITESYVLPNPADLGVLSTPKSLFISLYPSFKSSFKNPVKLTVLYSELERILIKGLEAPFLF